MPDHRCKRKELSVLLTQDEEDKEADESVLAEEAKPELETAEINQIIEVLLNSVAGLTTPQTMKLRGNVQN